MAEVVFTLNPMVEPRFTLMSVAKPWMDALPEPVMFHSVLGFPVLVFSQATSVSTGASHAAAAAGRGTAATNAAPKLGARKTASRGRPRLSRWTVMVPDERMTLPPGQPPD